MQRLYAKAVGWAVAGGCSSREQLTLERRLLGLCRPFLEDPLAVQGKLCRRIERHIKELFVFVSRPETPPDNNAAERSLRHLVISRKISGGTRSRAGSGSKMTLASLFGTWRARGLNPLLECRRLLVSLNSEQLQRTLQRSVSGGLADVGGAVDSLDRRNDGWSREWDHLICNATGGRVCLRIKVGHDVLAE